MVSIHQISVALIAFCIGSAKDMVPLDIGSSILPGSRGGGYDSGENGMTDGGEGGMADEILVSVQQAGMLNCSKELQGVLLVAEILKDQASSNPIVTPWMSTSGRKASQSASAKYYKTRGKAAR